MKTKLLVIALAFCTYANAQKDSIMAFKKNAVYFEGLGNGLLYSVNYERMIFQKNKIHVCGRIGIEAVPPVLWSAGGVVIPLEVNMLVGKQKRFFEVGIGYDFFQSLDGKKRIWVQDYEPYDGGGTTINGQIYPSGPTERVEYTKQLFIFRLGFRRVYGSGFFWRAGWTPNIFYKAGYKMEPYDKLIGFSGPVDNNKIETIPDKYANSMYKTVQYKAEVNLLWAGFSVGFRF